jgi:arylsulfatase A-like enzyme
VKRVPLKSQIEEVESENGSGGPLEVLSCLITRRKKRKKDRSSYFPSLAHTYYMADPEQLFPHEERKADFEILHDEEVEVEEVVGVEDTPLEIGPTNERSLDGIASPNLVSFSSSLEDMTRKVRCSVVVLVFLIGALCFIISLKVYNSRTPSRPPNILFILMDDLGWSDGSYHGGVVPTPNLEWLSTQSIELMSMYSQPLCTPARAAALTGRYPIRYGLQQGVIEPMDPSGLPLNEITLPSVLGRLGYETHLFGKWHLGFFQKDYIPSRRGFDTHTGFWLGEQSYYTHRRGGKYSFQHNEEVLWEANNTFSDLFLLQDLQKLLHKKRDSLDRGEEEKPFFICFWPQLVHSPYEVPQAYSQLFQTNKSANHTPDFTSVHKGMVTMLDDILGEVFSTLKETRFWDDNLIMLVQSDNGGPAPWHSNWPLRGQKATLWEGGVRVPAWIYATPNWLPEPLRGTKNKGMFHITDWFPTLVTQVLVGLKVDEKKQDELWSSLPKLDGTNIFECLLNLTPSPRSEVFLNFNTNFNFSAIRHKEWKLVQGPNACVPGGCGWYSPSPTYRYTPAFSNSSIGGVWLFNITADPNERENLADTFPEEVIKLLHRLDHYRRKSVPPWLPLEDPGSLSGETWRPWR